jgi:hypothetical protein
LASVGSGKQHQQAAKVHVFVQVYNCSFGPVTVVCLLEKFEVVFAQMFLHSILQEDAIKISDFNLDTFLLFMSRLCNRQDIDKIFTEM